VCFAQAVDRPRIEPSLTLRGLEPQVIRGRNGLMLNRSTAARIIVQALTGLARGPISLPLRIDAIRLSSGDLAGAEVKTSTTLSAPVELSYGPSGWHLSPPKIASTLQL